MSIDMMTDKVEQSKKGIFLDKGYREGQVFKYYKQKKKNDSKTKNTKQNRNK